MKWLWNLIWTSRKDVSLALLGMVLLPIMTSYLVEAFPV